MNDERASEGLDHLQSAALEMIKAARAFLDVAEGLAADKEKVADIAAAFGSVAGAASRAARGAPPRARPTHADTDGRSRGDDGVEHIRVL